MHCSIPGNFPFPSARGPDPLSDCRKRRKQVIWSERSKVSDTSSKRAQVSWLQGGSERTGAKRLSCHAQNNTCSFVPCAPSLPSASPLSSASTSICSFDNRRKTRMTFKTCGKTTDACVVHFYHCRCSRITLERCPQHCEVPHYSFRNTYCS